jgi:hypothetical protein
MNKPNWKVATLSGVVAATGLGGFALVRADADEPPVRSVELQRTASDGSLGSVGYDSALSSPASTTIVTPVPPTTLPAPVTVPVPPAAPATVPPPSVSFDDSVDSPVFVPPAPAPAPPAPVADDSGNDSWDDGADDSWDDAGDSD